MHGRDRLGEKAAASSHRWLSVSVSHEMWPPDGGRRHNGNPSLQEVYFNERRWSLFHGAKEKENVITDCRPLGGKERFTRIQDDCDFEKM